MDESHTENYILILYDSIYVTFGKKTIETEIKSVVTRGCNWEKGDCEAE